MDSPEDKQKEHEEFIRETTIQLKKAALKGILDLREKYGIFGAEKWAEYELFSRTLIACEIYLMEDDEQTDN